MSEHDCLFCRIASRKLESSIVFEDDRSVAFRDVNPQAPVHMLIIPRQHITSLAEIVEGDSALLGHLVYVAKKLAAEEQLPKNGYRVVINTGGYAGQTVPHLHVHLLGGRAFRWPPG